MAKNPSAVLTHFVHSQTVLLIIALRLCSLMAVAMAMGKLLRVQELVCTGVKDIHSEFYITAVTRSWFGVTMSLKIKEKLK